MAIRGDHPMRRVAQEALDTLLDNPVRYGPVEALQAGNPSKFPLIVGDDRQAMGQGDARDHQVALSNGHVLEGHPETRVFPGGLGIEGEDHEWLQECLNIFRVLVWVLAVEGAVPEFRLVHGADGHIFRGQGLEMRSHFGAVP